MTYKILVVDDESATAFGLKALLENEKVEVLTAVNAKAAREILDAESIQVLLSDIRLKGTLDAEGLELLRYVAEKSPGTRTILMTGYGDPAVMQRAFDLGAAFYFEKPVELTTLSEAIRELGVPSGLSGE